MSCSFTNCHHEMYYKTMISNQTIIHKSDHISWIYITFQWVIKQSSSQFQVCILCGGLMTTFTMTCQTKSFIGPSGWWVLKLVRLRQTVRVGACSTTRIKIVLKTVVLQTSHVMHSESTCPRLLWTTNSYWLSYRLGLYATFTCIYKRQSSHQVPESGDTVLQSAFLRPFTIVWWKPQSSNLSISCFKI